jgi:argininosuccinate lyase
MALWPASTHADPTPMSVQPTRQQIQAWSALFSEPMSELVQRYTASVGFDQRLWRADIAGSLAHAEMLAAQGIISARTWPTSSAAWPQITAEIEAGAFEWKLELEDVHLNIEARLTSWSATPASACTPAAAATTRWPPTCACGCAARSTACGLLADMQRALVDVAERTRRHRDARLHPPAGGAAGELCHHLLAYVEMFARDAERLADVRKRVNRLPLGAAALAGTSYPLDRERVARTLGFDGLCQNSLDAVSDRDFAIEFRPSPRWAWCTSRAWPRSWCCG